MANPVALYARAWVEICGQYGGDSKRQVALYARAWVEIKMITDIVLTLFCRPLREGVGRNHKLQKVLRILAVALYARAWVEIM